MRLIFNKGFLGLAFLMSALFLLSCGSENDELEVVSFLSGTIDGSNITNANDNVSRSATIALTFSNTLSAQAFESALAISSDGQPTAFTVTLQSSGTRALITPELEQDKTYQVSLSGAIGANGGVLQQPLNFSFSVAQDENNTNVQACSSATNDCLRQWQFSSGNENGTLSYYSNYSLENTQNAEDLEYALIVIHGINRNNNEYFNWVSSALQKTSREESTLLIAPQFKVNDEAQAGDLYWSNTGWREGRNSQSDLSLSSFAVIDSIVTHLGDVGKYPALKKIIITGHSSGGLFTHVYGASNAVESLNTDMEMQYVVANSQYFFYPDDQRLNENNGQLYTPTNCTGYNIWPMGSRNKPPYLSNTSDEQLSTQFVDRAIIYFLGNGTGPDGALNQTNCAATLLGSTRFDRGENMYTYMELNFPNHKHQKRLVQGVAHNGQAMYLSEEFEALLSELF